MTLPEIKDWLSPAATIIVGVIAVIGWIANSHYNREHHMFQKRFEKRMEMFDKLITVMLSFGDQSRTRTEDPEIWAKLAKANTAIQLYGYADEIELYKKITDAVEKKDDQAYTESVKKLPSLLKKMRKELGYPDSVSI